MPGPAKKLLALKLLQGTSRPCRDQPAGVVLPALSALPAPPAWLPNLIAHREWSTVGPVLVATGLLTSASLSTFAAYCSIVGINSQLFADGASPPASMLAQQIAFANAFGLTPTAAAKISPAAPTAPNRFLTNGRKPL